MKSVLSCGQLHIFHAHTKTTYLLPLAPVMKLKRSHAHFFQQTQCSHALSNNINIISCPACLNSRTFQHFPHGNKLIALFCVVVLHKVTDQFFPFPTWEWLCFDNPCCIRAEMGAHVHTQTHAFDMLKQACPTAPLPEITARAGTAPVHRNSLPDEGSFSSRTPLLTPHFPTHAKHKGTPTGFTLNEKH